jgi:hypothetical protein
MLRNGVPPWLRPDIQPSSLRRPYLIYPEKLANETWRMFEQANLAQFDKPSGDFAVPPALGLFTLSLIAEECAGKTRTKITDRDRAYAWLCGVMTERLGGEYLPTLQASQLAATYDRLVTASVRVLNTDGIPLKRLMSLRKKEQAGQAPELQPLRAKYLATLDEHVKLLLQPSLRTSDAREIERQFERDRQNDFRELKRELGLAAKDVLFTKEIGVLALAVAGAVATPFMAPAAASLTVPAAASIKGLGVGALLVTKAKYRKARESALNRNAMSWLYVTSKRRWL